MNFTTKFLGKPFFHLTTVDSTQTYAKQLITENRAATGTVILTDHQQTGKGTQGRTWFSLPEPQLMFSTILAPKMAPHKLPIINILSGVLLAEVFEELNIDAKIKWPNDLYVDGKKAGGILSELYVHNKETYVILGIGINTHASADDFPTSLQSTATALSLHSKQTIDRMEILNKFLQKLEIAIYTWTPDEIIRHAKQGFEKFWIYRGKTIEIMQNEKKILGHAETIDDSGALLLIAKNGTEKIISGVMTLV